MTTRPTGPGRPGRQWRRRLAATATAVTVAVVVTSCSDPAARPTGLPHAHGVTTTTAAPVSAGHVPFGVYVGPGDPASVASFGARTGTRPSLASDYLPSTMGWAGMTEAGRLADFVGPWQGSGYRLVLGVPMIPTDHGSPVGSLEGGASGAHDVQFKTLAQTLVSYGQGDAVLRVGWEFNASWYPWAVTDPQSAQHYAAYFRHIVDAMRSVPGADFRFVWNPTPGSSPVDLALAYPGDAYVDYVGLDVYDQVWDVAQDPLSAWNSYLTEDFGLRWLATFAQAHHRPVVIPEWGLAIRSDGHGLADDPAFVTNMSNWLATHHAAFASFFDLNAPDGEHDILDGHFRRSLVVFERMFASSRPTPLRP